MTLEATLEKLAASVERIEAAVTGGGGVKVNVTTTKTEAPKPAAEKPKAAEKPAEKKSSLTLDDVRKAAFAALKALGSGDDAKKAVDEVTAKHGATKVAELKEELWDAAVEDYKQLAASVS